MSQVIVVNNSLKIANNLCNILEQRDITVIKAGGGSSKPNFWSISSTKALFRIIFFRNSALTDAAPVVPGNVLYMKCFKASSLFFNL